MDTLHIFNILDREIRLNYNSKAEFANKVNVSKQRLNEVLNVLKSCRERNSFNVICSILEKAGYEVVIKKKGE